MGKDSSTLLSIYNNDLRVNVKKKQSGCVTWMDDIKWYKIVLSYSDLSVSNSLDISMDATVYTY